MILGVTENGLLAGLAPLMVATGKRTSDDAHFLVILAEHRDCSGTSKFYIVNLMNFDVKLWTTHCRQCMVVEKGATSISLHTASFSSLIPTRWAKIYVMAGRGDGKHECVDPGRNIANTHL
jgi:hypothetical protein